MTYVRVVVVRSIRNGMEGESMTILDYIENIKVEGAPFNEPANEYFALLSLRTGLEYLYRFAQECDEVCLSQLNPKKKVFFSGNIPEVKGIPYQLLSCVFHWYSISACQYVRTVGTIAYRQDKSRTTSLKYLDSIIPEVKVFRDKVAAHFGWLTKNEHDNEAERLASIIPQVSFYDDSFQVGGLRISMTRSGNRTDSKQITPWSIVKVHKRLRERYWPEQLEPAKTET